MNADTWDAVAFLIGEGGAGVVGVAESGAGRVAELSDASFAFPGAESAMSRDSGSSSLSFGTDLEPALARFLKDIAKVEIRFVEDGQSINHS